MLQDVWSDTKILDFDNLFDFGYLAAGWVAILRQLWNLESLEKPFMSLYCGMSWLRILWILRGALWERTVTQILHGRSGRSTLNPYNICYPGIAPDVRNIWNATYPFAPTWTQVHIALHTQMLDLRWVLDGSRAPSHSLRPQGYGSFFHSHNHVAAGGHPRVLQSSDQGLWKTKNERTGMNGQLFFFWLSRMDIRIVSWLQCQCSPRWVHTNGYFFATLSAYILLKSPRTPHLHFTSPIVAAGIIKWLTCIS